MTETSVPENEENATRFELVNRVAEYPSVTYIAETVTSTYNYVKQSNSYIQSGLETAENLAVPVLQTIDNISKTPMVDSILATADAYGCKQLDKLEGRAAAIKSSVEAVGPRTLEKVDQMADKIHGTKVETVAFFSLGVVDAIVDSLLPADPSKKKEEYRVGTEDPNVVDAAGPLYNKLVSRVSRENVRQLPVRTYNEMKDLVFKGADAVPQIQFCIGVLLTAAHRLQEGQEAALANLQKGAALSKASVESSYQSMQNMLPVLSSIVQSMKKMDQKDAAAALQDLTNMISKSKEDVMNRLTSENSKQIATRIKNDFSNILQNAGNFLSDQLTPGYALKESAPVKKAAETLEAIVARIVESLPSTSAQPKEDAATTTQSSASSQ